MSLVDRMQKNVKGLALAGAVAVMPYLNGCQTANNGNPNYARENEIDEKKIVGAVAMLSNNPLIGLLGNLSWSDAQNQERNDAIKNMGRGNGNLEGSQQGNGRVWIRNAGINEQDGEFIELNRFGNVYACLALNRLGGESAPMHKGKGQFVAITSSMEEGSGNGWFYVEASGNMGNPKFAIYDRKSGNMISSSEQNNGIYNYMIIPIDRKNLPKGEYVAVVSGEKVKRGKMNEEPSKVVEFPFIVK